MKKRYTTDLNKVAEGMTSQDLETRMATLAELYPDMWPIMCKVFNNVSGDYDEAEELAQATNARIAEIISEAPLAHTKNIVGYFSTVGQNLHTTNYRKEGKQHLISIDADNFPEHLHATEDDSTDENLVSKISNDEIRGIYHTLLPKEAVKWLAWKLGKYNPAQIKCIFPYSESAATIRRQCKSVDDLVKSRLIDRQTELDGASTNAFLLPQEGYSGFTTLGCNLDNLTQDGCRALCKALDVDDLKQLKERYLGMIILHVVDIATVELRICFSPIHMGLDYLSGITTPYLECKPLFVTDQKAKRMLWYPTDLLNFTCKMVNKQYDAQRAIHVGTWLYDLPRYKVMISKEIDAHVASMFADPIPQIGTPFSFQASFMGS